MEHAQPVNQSSGGWKQRLVFSAVVSAALAFTLCLFGPLDLFFNNYEELWFHFQDIIGGVAVIALEDGTLTLDFTFTDVSESEEDKEAGTRTQTMPVTKLVITAAE